jgi:hypothetical protein
MSLLNEIKNKINKHDVPEEKITHEPSYINNSVNVGTVNKPEPLTEVDTKTTLIDQALRLTSSWVNQDSSHRIVFNVSRLFNYKDDSTTSKTTNNYSSVFDTAEYNDKDRQYYFSAGGSNKKGVYSIVKLDDFSNGLVKWDSNRKNLVVTNEDNSYIIRISYMKDGTIIDMDKDSRGLANVFNNLI